MYTESATGKEEKKSHMKGITPKDILPIQIIMAKHYH